MNKAQRLDSEEEVEGYYTIDQYGNNYIVNVNGNPKDKTYPFYKVKPDTLKRQITSTGEWVNVDDTEVVKKEQKYIEKSFLESILKENINECVSLMITKRIKKANNY